MDVRQDLGSADVVVRDIDESHHILILPCVPVEDDLPSPVRGDPFDLDHEAPAVLVDDASGLESRYVDVDGCVDQHFDVLARSHAIRGFPWISISDASAARSS